MVYLHIKKGCFSVKLEILLNKKLPKFLQFLFQNELFLLIQMKFILTSPYFFVFNSSNSIQSIQAASQQSNLYLLP